MGTHAGLEQAQGDFAAALTLETSHQEARLLRAITSLLLLEGDPALEQTLGALGATREGSLRSGGTIDGDKDADGDFIPAIGATTTVAVDWIDDHLLPSLAIIRADLALIVDDAFRTDLTARETGIADALVDKGDVLIAKAATHGLEMTVNLAFTYDLRIPLESLYTLQKLEKLTAQETMTTLETLLEFAADDRRPQFATAMRAMEQDYAVASDFIRNQRGDPSGLLTEVLSMPPEVEGDLSLEERIREGSALAVSSLDGEVEYQETRVNLSRLVATNTPARSWLPQFLGDQVVPGTLPDPTFDGVLPETTLNQVDNRIYQLGHLWGMAQYAEDFGVLLESMGLPSGPFDDADDDRRDNFSEWLRATNPTRPDVVWQALTREVLVPGQPEVRMSFVRRKDMEHWKLRVVVSDDLESWDRTETQVEMVGQPIDNGDAFSETVTYRLKAGAALAARKYLGIEAALK